MLKTFRKSRQREAKTTVEFVLVAPVFLLVLFSCFEFARISMLRNLAQNAAYEACRLAMMEGATEVEGENEANSVLARLGTQGATVETSFQPIRRDDGSIVEPNAFVTTRVTIPIGQNTIVFPASAFGDKAIVAETQLRSERYIGFFETTEAASSSD